MQLLLFGAAVLLFLKVVHEALCAWELRVWRTDPDVPAFWKKYRAHPHKYVAQQVIENRVAAISQNDSRIDNKVARLKEAQRVLIILVVYLVLIVIFKPYLP